MSECRELVDKDEIIQEKQPITPRHKHSNRHPHKPMLQVITQ